MIINFKIVDRLSRELDTRVARNEMIASNIANIDTPGYKARDVQFRRALSGAVENLELKLTDPRHIPADVPITAEAGRPAVVESKAQGRPDGNNVDIDDEMLKLTQNNIEYNIAVQLVAKKLSGIKQVIMEARR